MSITIKITFSFVFIMITFISLYQFDCIQINNNTNIKHLSSFILIHKSNGKSKTLIEFKDNHNRNLNYFFIKKLISCITTTKKNFPFKWNLH